MDPYLDPHWLDSEGRDPDISPMPTRRMTQLDEADRAVQIGDGPA